MINKEQIQTYTLGKLQMYDECPQKYKLCFIDKVHIIENIIFSKSSKTGNNLHNLINYYFKEMDISNLIPTLTQNEKVLWHNFKNNQLQNYKIAASEYSFNLKLDEYWLTGRIDAMLEYDEKYIILDWKTGENFRPENVKFQTSFYLFCMYEVLKAKKYIKIPEQLSLHYVNISSGNVVKIDFNKDLYLNYKTQILEIINKINNNNTFFCNKSDNCKNCKYYRACPYW